MQMTLKDLGWSAFFDRQWDRETLGETPPLRIAEVHRDRLEALGPDGPAELITGGESTGDFAVGDWVLAEAGRVTHRFDRQTELARRAAGTDARRQLIAANVDTLFVVSSCNADFNIARLERYLALAQGAGCFPVILLTKADMCDDPQDYIRRAERAAGMAPVLALNALDTEELFEVAAWCGPGQTGALLGSSGVGKSTLLNGLTGATLATQAIREDDAKGRHTTTHRALKRMTNGGWLIDTPGMRALRLTGAADGIDAVFDDLTELATQCRFADCQHGSEPGCAVQAAIAAGEVEPERLKRWQKLQREEARNSETLAEARARDKAFGKMVRGIMRDHRGRKGN